MHHSPESVITAPYGKGRRARQGSQQAVRAKQQVRQVVTSPCCSGCDDVASSSVVSQDRMMQPRQRQTAPTGTGPPKGVFFEVTHPTGLVNRSLPVVTRRSTGKRSARASATPTL